VPVFLIFTKTLILLKIDHRNRQKPIKPFRRLAALAEPYVLSVMSLSLRAGS